MRSGYACGPFMRCEMSVTVNPCHGSHSLFNDASLCPGPADGNVREYKDDSAKGLDPEKAAKASTGGSSRGSAQFLSEVEGQRAIKVSALAYCIIFAPPEHHGHAVRC